jgi:hypothetical protein
MTSTFGVLFFFLCEECLIPNLVSTSHKTHFVYITIQTGQYCFGEIIVVHYEITENFLILKQMVHIVTNF